MLTTTPPHASAFNPFLHGMGSPRHTNFHEDNGGPPQKQRRKPPPNPTSTYKLTCGLLDSYRKANPSFVYVGSIQNPRRVLTKDARPSGNHGFDNKSSDLILTVGDVLCSANGGPKFRVLDMLGQGTFGQVVKCRAEWDSERDDSPTLSTSSPGTSPASSGMEELKSGFKKPYHNSQMVAVKIVKNKPAYFNQAKVEIKVLKKIGDELGPGTNPGDLGSSLIRLLHDFEYHHHLCLVFELMSVNLYELIKHQDFRGLPFARVRAFCEQLLDALDCLCRLGVIHCDLKPENILLENFGDPHQPRIKLIDLGSACYHDHVAFTYIQSRFYRAPEVLLGVKYSAPIDLWSLGCVAVELFMGLPVFPGVSAHNQLTRIIEMLGSPPAWMIEEGKKGETYFVRVSRGTSRHSDADAVVGELELEMREDYFSMDRKPSPDEPIPKKHTGVPITKEPMWRLKTAQEWAFENGLRDGPEKTKRYVKEKTLPGVIIKCESKRRPKNEPAESISMQDLECFIDFCSGLLRLDPNLRWTAFQAMKHPFIRQTRYDSPFVPSTTPEPVMEETEDDLLFAEKADEDYAPELDVEMEDEEEEDTLKEEERRVKPRAAPMAIGRSHYATAASSTTPSTTGGLTSASAASFSTSQQKSLGLSSSQQQRYKRKLSDANVAASPATTASSLSSVFGSPITRPDVPYPIAHQSRWSDLGLLASPKVGPLGLPYHSVLPPAALDQMGSPTTLGAASARAVSYGSSLPAGRSLLSQQMGAGDVPAFRRLDFQNAQGAAVMGPAYGTSSSSSSAYWPFSSSYTGAGSTGLGGGSAAAAAAAANAAHLSRVSPASGTTVAAGSLGTLANTPRTVLGQMVGSSSTSATLAADFMLPATHTQPISLDESNASAARLSSSWTATTSAQMIGDSVVLKKRAESDNGGSGQALTEVNPVPLTEASATAASVVMVKSLEKWAPFDKNEEHKTS